MHAYDDMMADYRALKRAVRGHILPGQGRVWRAPENASRWLYRHRLGLSFMATLILVSFGAGAYYGVPLVVRGSSTVWETFTAEKSPPPTVGFPTFPATPPAVPQVRQPMPALTGFEGIEQFRNTLGTVVMPCVMTLVVLVGAGLLYSGRGLSRLFPLVLGLMAFGMAFYMLRAMVS